MQKSMSKKDRKMIPKSSKNDTKMALKLIPKSSFSRHGDFMKSMVFPQEKHTFRGFEHPKSDPKSNEKPFKIDARKNDAKIMQNRAKMEPKRDTNQPKIH